MVEELIEEETLAPVVAIVLVDGSYVVGQLGETNTQTKIGLYAPLRFMQADIEMGNGEMQTAMIPTLYMPFVDFDQEVVIKLSNAVSIVECSEHDTRKYYHSISKIVIEDSKWRLRESIEMDKLEFGEQIIQSGGANYPIVIH